MKILDPVCKGLVLPFANKRIAYTKNQRKDSLCPANLLAENFS